MSRFKKIALAVLAACLAVCAGVAIAACDGGGIRNPNDTDNKYVYTVTLASQGGLPIKGVTVSLATDGETKSDKIISDNTGKAVFEMDEAVDYEVVLDSDTIPAGFRPVSSVTTKITAAAKAVTLRFNSSIIMESAPVGTVYSVGDVIHNFSFKDAADGEEYDLAETLAEKKAVMLNFWGTNCKPCTSEFPAIQQAYEEYSDKIEIFALSSYLQADTASQIASFKENGGYTFPMGLDYGAGTAQVYTHFSLSGYPTTVIIDRFGVVAYKDSGSNSSAASWKALFERFTSDEYDPSKEINPDETESLVLTPRPAGMTGSDSAAIDAAISDSSLAGKLNGYYFDGEIEDEYDWYWSVATVGDRTVLRPNNDGDDWTYASFSFTIDMKPGEGLQYDYYTDTLADENILNVLINGKNVHTHLRSSGGWQTCRDTSNGPLYIANRTSTVTVTFLYLKANKVADVTPVYIDNIAVYDATQTSTTTRDLAFSPVEGLTPNSNGYYNIDIELGEDGVYYYNYVNNSGKSEKVMLVADVLGVTYWVERHLTDTRFVVTHTDTSLSPTYNDASLYNISYWYWDKGFSYNGDSYTNALYTTYYLQGFSESNYVPVTQSVQEMLYAFTKCAYETKYNLTDDEYTLSEIAPTDAWYEEQWLEFCYYFMHFGPEHANPNDCFEHFNTSAGLIFDLAFEANLGENDVNITKILSMSFDEIEAGGGIRFKFTPEENGIYLLYSTHDTSKDDVDEDGNYIGVDPYVRVIDLDNKTVITENNDDNRRGHLDTADFHTYVELRAGVTYGITACMNFYQDTGKYTLNIEKCEEDHIAKLQTCTYSNTTTWYIDENGDPTDADGNPVENPVYYFMAIKTALNPDTGLYYEYLEGGEFGEVIYIDFTGSNYWYTSGASLYDAICGYQQLDDNKNPVFDKDGNPVMVYPLGEYTEPLKEYYEKSIANKDENNELYGMIEASADLVNILSAIQGETVEARYWERFAYYYVHYYTPSN